MNKKTNWQKTVTQVGTLIILLLLLTLLPSQSVYAATITVNSTADTIAAGDTVCTLREAIMNANRIDDTDGTGGDCVAGNGADIINLGSNLTYSLTITGVNDNDNLEGDLDITDPDGLTIIGNNAIIESDINDRVFHIISGATATIQDVTIQNGHFNGSGDGGGIFNDGELIITNAVIDGNSATLGGGIYNNNGSTLTINNSEITNNSGFGGGILNYSLLYINDSELSNNICNGCDGGGIRNQGTLILNRSMISDNTARDGAGIWNQNATLELNNSTISTNTSSRNGGGLYINAPATINNSTIANNTASGTGGGINHAGGTLTINNSTISTNSTSLNGGAIYINAQTTINNSTIANNTASGTGGGIHNAGGTVNIKNTIIADNTASTSDPDCSGTLTSHDYNLIEDTTGCTIAGTTTNNIPPGSDPELKALANYGGSTDTHELEETSPARDGGETGSCTAIDGSAIATDQRGETRPENSGCDIGSFELGALAVDLASFTATNEGSHLRVEWATVLETNNLGFNLYRNTSAEFPEAEPLNSAIIEAIGPGSGSGFTYEYEDHDIVLGATYHYWLVDLDVGGNETRHGPISIDYDNIPTSVRMTDFESHKPSNLSWLVMLAVLGMTIGAISMQRRQ